MDIRELKTMDATRLVRMAGDFQIENAGVLRRQELVYRIIQAQARKNGHLVAEGVLERVQEGYGFLRALEATGWNIQEASHKLGISRATVYRKLERYGLDPEGTRPQAG